MPPSGHTPGPAPPERELRGGAIASVLALNKKGKEMQKYLLGIIFILFPIALTISCRQTKPLIPEPPAFRSMCDNSDLIIIGTMADKNTIEATSQYLSDDTVLKIQTHILDILKGNPTGDTITCYTFFRSADPITELGLGDSLMLFLRILKGTDEYTAYSGVLDIRHLSGANFAFMAQRTREYLDIASHRNYQDQDIVEWLVKCAEDTSMRWDAINDLYSSYQAYNKKQQRPSRKLVLKVELSPAQRRRLYEAILKTPVMEDSEFRMLDMADGKFDTRILPQLIAYIQNHQDNPDNNTLRSMRYICNLTAAPGAGPLVVAYEFTRPDSTGEQERRKIIGDFLSLLSKRI